MNLNYKSIFIFLLLFVSRLLHSQNQKVDLTVNCFDQVSGNGRCATFDIGQVDFLSGIQFTISFDPSVLKLQGTIGTGNSVLPIIGPSSFGLDSLYRGIITFIWTGSPITVSQTSNMFEICFEYIGEPGETTLIDINALVTDIDIVTDIGTATADIHPCITEVLPNGSRIVKKFCNPTTNQSKDGKISFYGIGGIAPYDYVVKDGANNVIKTGKAADKEEIAVDNIMRGNYTISMTDANGIPFAPITINLIDAGVLPKFDLEGKNPSCFYKRDGVLSLKNIVVDFIPYKVQWSNGTFNAKELADLPTGTYTATIIDANKCEITKTFTLKADTIKILPTIVFDADCKGSKTGAVKIQVSGGTPYADGTYDIALNNNTFKKETNPFTWTNAPGGNVVIKVKDKAINYLGNPSPCLVEQAVKIGYKDTLKFVNVMVADAKCKGDFGSIKFEVEGPTPVTFPIQKNIDLNQTMNPVGASNNVSYINNELRAGRYLIQAKSVAKGCLDTILFEIKEPPTKFVASSNVVQPSCASLGSISVTAINGQAPYSYKWNDSFVGPNRNDLGPGDYTITITDATLCDTVLLIKLLPAGGSSADAGVLKAIKCKNDKNGEVIAKPDNASYQWKDKNGNNIGTTQTITGLGWGSYFVTVTKDGCVSKDSIFLANPAGMNISNVEIIKPECPKGGNKGSIGLTMEGGFSPYVYQWKKQGNTTVIGTQAQLTNIEAGTFLVTITDQNQCSKDTSIAVQAPNQFNISISNILPISCFGLSDGDARAKATGGATNNGKYTFLWSNGQKSTSLFDMDINTTLPAGQNWVIAADTKCISDTVFFAIPNKVQIKSVEIVSGICAGACNGSAEVKGSGGNGFLSVSWPSIPQTNTNIVYNLCAGDYPYVITDADGCFTKDTITIQEVDSIKLSIDQNLTLPLSCRVAQGQIAINVLGGKPEYKYAWKDGVSTDYIAKNLPQGTYFVTVTDASGCTGTLSYELERPNAVKATVAQPEPINCYGGKACIGVDDVSGGSGQGYTMQINNGLRIPVDSCLQVLAGEYIISVYDGSGCKTDLDYVVTQPEPISVNLGDDINLNIGDTIPIITAQASNGTKLISYLWTGVEGLTFVDTSKTALTGTATSNKYINVTVIDENGCVGKDDIVITVSDVRNVFFPNIINSIPDSPNGKFEIAVGQGVEIIENLIIYDRWGNAVYKKTNYLPDGTTGWNGTYNNEILAPAVFVFTATIKFVDGATKYYKGDITLIK